MRIVVIFGSQRKNGTASLIEQRIDQIKGDLVLDFIKMSETSIEGCVACAKCSDTGKCALPESTEDMFNVILKRLILADVIFVITPIYSPYPSRLTALMERLTSISYFSSSIGKLQRPLKNKKSAIIAYGASKIEDEKQLKLLFQKFFMDDYSFTEVSYPFINNIEDPNSRYSNVIEYVEDIIELLRE